MSNWFLGLFTGNASTSKAATVRISNIPESVTEEQFVSFLHENELLPRGVHHTKLLFIATARETKQTIVTLKDGQAFERALRLEKMLEGRLLNFDDTFDGITVLSEGTECDVIALHGMHGHAFDTWAHYAEGYRFMWLQDCLPERLPQARIMVFGYDANVVTDLSKGRIRTFADQLLERLRTVRVDIDPKRPLILIGYSLGGLVIKQALITAKNRADDRFKSIVDSVAGVQFIGTPHSGIKGVDSETFIRNFAGAFKVDGANPTFVSEQQDGANGLFDLTNDFKQLIENKKISVKTLYELKATPFEGGKPMWIVNEQSATLGVAEESKSGLNAKHADLCKFKGPGVDALETIIDNVKELFTNTLSKAVKPLADAVPNADVRPEAGAGQAGVTPEAENVAKSGATQDI